MIKKHLCGIMDKYVMYTSICIYGSVYAFRNRRESPMANLKDTTYLFIKNKILDCSYAPNSFINEAEVMKEIDVSRTPVREAFSKLEQEGFIEVIPKKGVLVKALTISIINQTFESRQLLEPFIIENYMKYVDRKELRSIMEDSRAMLHAPENHEDFCEMDDHLHRVITAACPNVFFIDMLKHIFDQNQRIRKLNGPDIWERHLVAAQEHIEIITAILHEEYTHAAELMRKHLDYSKSTALISLSSKEISF